MPNELIEANVDALVGPSHHYGGLGVGNVASIEHQLQESHPRQAALEGLQKAALVAQLGVPQFVWLPPLRPDFRLLQSVGFVGSEAEQLAAAYDQAPPVLSAAYSSAFMWAANAATVSPSCDCFDRRLHITPANLISSWHRWTEATDRRNDFDDLFAPRSTDPADSTIHPPLASIFPLRDEGAANHMRLCDRSGLIGFNIFVHGGDQFDRAVFLPRHSRAASQAIARLHRLDTDRTYFLQQHPRAISAGAFHNDVIATSHRGLLIHHQFAFTEESLPELLSCERRYHELIGEPLVRIVIDDRQLSLADAVSSYFFNSQIVSLPDTQAGESRPAMALICPRQCRETVATQRLIEQLIADPAVPIEQVHYVALAESMAGGGGPACLRLRLPVTALQLQRMGGLRLTDALIDQIRQIIDQQYPETVTFSDLRQWSFAEKIRGIHRQLRQRLSCA